MSSLASLLVLTLSLVSINCEDFCSVLKPNGQYRGVSAYRNGSNGTYWMNNRNGREWKIDIDMNGTMTADYQSIRDVDPHNTVDRIRGYYNTNIKIIAIECNVFASEPTQQRPMECKTVVIKQNKPKRKWTENINIQ